MRFLRFRTFCAVFIYLFAAQNSNVRAETATDWVVTDQSHLRLISELDGVKEHESLRLGLQIKLAPGWKTYWRSPGDAGIPPRFDWSGSKNLKESKILWPLPEKFDAYGLSSWGYHDEVVFPIDITLLEPGKPLELKLRLQIGICEDVCIPYEHEFALSIGAESARTSPEGAVIDRFFRRVPVEIGSEGAVLQKAAAHSKDDHKFAVTIFSDRPFVEPAIIVEGKEGAYFNLVSKAFSDDRKRATFNLEGRLPLKMDRMPGQNITVTVFDEGFAGEKKLRVD